MGLFPSHEKSFDEWTKGPSEAYLKKEQEEKDRISIINEQDIQKQMDKVKSDLRYAYEERGKECIQYDAWMDCQSGQAFAADLSKALVRLRAIDSRISVDHLNDYSCMVYLRPDADDVTFFLKMGFSWKEIYFIGSAGTFTLTGSTMGYMHLSYRTRDQYTYKD